MVKQTIRPIRVHCQPETRIGLKRYTRAGSDRGDSEIRDIRAQASGARVRIFMFEANSVEELCEAVNRLAQSVAQYRLPLRYVESRSAQ